MSSRLSRRALAGMLALTVFAAGVGIGARMSASNADDQRTTEAAPTPAMPQQTSANLAGRARDDAVLAAAALTMLFDGAGLLDDTRRARLLEDAAASAERPRLASDLAEVAAVVSDALGVADVDLRDPAVVWRSVPAGARVESFEQDRAVVSIWGTGVIILPDLPLTQPGWRTTTVEIVWERDAWRLADFRSQRGPEPPAVGGTPGAASRAHLISGFEPLPLPLPTVSGQQR